jgi:peptide-methionine (S)-S-oxide reductase
VRAQVRYNTAAMKWFVAIALTMIAAGFIISRLPVREAALEPPIGDPSVGTHPGNAGRGTPLATSGGNELALFAQGCFWGVEERFRRVPGVVATAAGYTGGRTPAPTYEQVSAGGTGHAEAVLVEFDPRRVSYDRLLAVFWQTHDPTTGDRQGGDRGNQYRSAIFALSDAQLKAALASRDEEQRQLVDPITTEIARAGPFWMAEDEHQQWDEKHGKRSCPAPERARRK